MADNKDKFDPKTDKGQIIDTRKRVKVIALKDAPYHSEGEEIEVAPAVAEKMIKNKWAKKAEKD